MKKSLLLMGLAVASSTAVWADKAPFEGITIDEAAKMEGVYLYNVEAGVWLQNNDITREDWTTRGAVGTRGIDWKITCTLPNDTDPASSEYQLNPKFGHNHSMNFNNFYLDTGDGVTKYFFEQTGDADNPKGYLISSDDANKFLGVDANGKLAWVSEGEQTTWLLVTREERLKMLEGATADKPVDATWLVQATDMANQDERRGAWKISTTKAPIAWGGEGAGTGGDGMVRGSRAQEFWNLASYKMEQTISGLPNGTYKVSVQGFYRDGSSEARDGGANSVYYVADRHASGEEQLHAVYYANGAEKPLMSIMAEAKDASEEGFGFEALKADGEGTVGSGKFVPNTTDAASRDFFYGAYKNEDITATVADGRLVLGMKKSEGVNDNWTVFKNFTLTYVGNQVDLTAVKEALQKAIDEAGAVEANSTDVLNKTMTDALATAKAALGSSSAEEIATATTGLNEAVGNVKATAEAVDKLRKATAAATEVKGEPVDNATKALAEATTNDELNRAFDALMKARRAAHVTYYANAFTGNAPAEGEFYLYNVGQKRFLQGGNDWGTHASLGTPGWPMKLVAGADGSFIIDTRLQNGNWNEAGEPDGDSHFLNYGGYVDTPTQDGWKFVEKGEGKYQIQRANDASRLLGFDPNSLDLVQTNVSEGDHEGDMNDRLMAANADDNLWILVTKADRDALLEKASKENPVDATYRINMPGFNQREFGNDTWQTFSGWFLAPGSEGSGVGIWGRGGNNDGKYAVESWNNANDFLLSQDLKDLPAGFYTVSVQGFYRVGTFDEHTQAVKDGKELPQNAKLVLTGDGDGVEAKLPLISAEADKAPGLGDRSVIGYIPNGVPQAVDYFNLGLYKTTGVVHVGDDGKLSIAIERSELPTKEDGNLYTNIDWIVADNFTLTYTGKDNVTGIKGVEETAAPQDGKMYNLAGQRVDKSYKGVVIVNGKKVVK